MEALTRCVVTAHVLDEDVKRSVLSNTEALVEPDKRSSRADG